MDNRKSEERIMENASGRDKFRKFKKIITFIAVILSILPRPIRKWIWDISDIFPGLVATVTKYSLLKGLVKRCGDNVYIGKGVVIKGWENIEIGHNVSLHANSYIDGTGGIVIGDNVSIAHHCSILSFEHTWQDESLPIKYNPIKYGSVMIENDVWIGCGCRILSSVCIEERSVVAAGAVVTKNVISKTLVGGVPAKKIKDIT